MYFLNINKPKGISSFDVIRRLRKILKIKQIGHSGTLDPLASGVLQIATGKATKLLDYLDSDKIYIANIRFGYITDTFDDEGDKTFVKNPDFSIDELNDCLNSFIGITKQSPPKYSAIKINGKKACDIIRKDKCDMIELKEREIEIYSIKLLNFEYDNTVIEVHCKKGTYIRSLVHDIGKKLNCGAYLTDLKRIKAGNFDIKNSDEIESENYKKINPLDCINLNTYELNNLELQKIIHGNSIPNNNFKEDEFILLTNNNILVSIAKISDNQIKPKKIFKEI